MNASPASSYVREPNSQPQRLTEDLNIMESLTPMASVADTSEDNASDTSEDNASDTSENIASRWWEVKAQSTLESTSFLKDIQLICKYVPFKDPNAASLALSKQWRPRLEALWMRAHVEYNKPWSLPYKVHEWRSSQVAESIVRLVLAGQEISTLHLGQQCWTPPRPNSSVSAEEIARSLDDYFCCLFLHVCSRDWTKAALGYHTTSVTSLLTNSLDTRTALYQWYEQNTLIASTCELVEEKLRSRNPSAYWAASARVTHPSDALRSLLSHFRTLSASQEGDIMCWVRQLAVLAERFQQNIRAMNVDWNKNLLAGSTLLHQISCEDMGALASAIVRENAAEYAPNQDNHGLVVRWKNLSENVRACAIIDSDMGESIGNLAKQLHEKKDYQSTTALLTGLRQAEVYPPAVSFALVDPDNDYAKYRAQWAQKPGIPFPFAQVKDSWSYQRKDAYTAIQGNLYGYVADEGHNDELERSQRGWTLYPRLAQLKELLKSFRCF